MKHLLLLFMLAIVLNGFSQNSSGNCFYIDYETWNAGTQPPVFFDCGKDPKFDVGNELTMEAWIRVYNAGWNQKILGKVHSPFDNGYIMAIEVGKNYSEIFNPVLNELKGGATPVDSAWVHFCTTFKAGEKMATYVNGVQTAELTPTNAPIGASDSSFIIGHAPWSEHSFQYFGYIDEVRIWNVAHSEEEVNSLMFKSLKGDEAGLVASYAFNESEGMVAHDNSSNQFHGNLNASADYFSWEASTAPVGDAVMYEMHDVDGIWFGKNDAEYNYLISDKGLGLIGKLSEKDFDYAIMGHDNANGTSSDGLTNMPENTVRVARTWYCNASQDVLADMVFQLSNAAGGGNELESVSAAARYTLLHKSSVNDAFVPLYCGNIVSGSAVIFNNIKLEDGYYSISLSDEQVVDPNAINQRFLNQIALFPNPNRGVFTIDLVQDSYIEIYNSSGQLVYNKQHQAEENHLQLTQLPASYYLVKITTTNKQYFTKLIIN